MSDHGSRHRPPSANEPTAPEAEEPQRPGGSVGGDRQWAQNRIRSHFSANRRISPKRGGAAGPEAKVPQSGGAPLPGDLRARMEPQLGADLSAARLHTGGESAQAASGFGARAFTIGNDVHFGAGQFAPGSKDGDQLLAHELTHVVQGQRAGVQRKADGEADAGAADGAEVSQPHEPAEKEADSVAEHAAEQLHGDGKQKGDAGGAKSAAPKIAAKRDPSATPASKDGAAAGAPPKKPGDDKAPEVPPKKFLDQDAAQKLLDDAYGAYKKIDKGKIEVLAQADFQAAYDKIYGAGEYSWAKYVKPGPGNLEGFAYKGTNYINKDCISLDTVPHEMLHNNADADFKSFVGSEFNEGTTEYLTIKAMEKAKKTPSHSYPSQEGCVRALVAAGCSEDDLKTAYFKGGAKKLLGDFVDKNCKGKWEEFKTAMQAKDFAKAKDHLQKKK